VKKPKKEEIQETSREKQLEKVKKNIPMLKKEVKILLEKILAENN